MSLTNEVIGGRYCVWSRRMTSYHSPMRSLEFENVYETSCKMTSCQSHWGHRRLKLCMKHHVGFVHVTQQWGHLGQYIWMAHQVGWPHVTITIEFTGGQNCEWQYEYDDNTIHQYDHWGVKFNMTHQVGWPHIIHKWGHWRVKFCMLHYAGWPHVTHQWGLWSANLVVPSKEVTVD
jgi:hypothetical protein